jgi:Domain of unknown function (DUF4440)
MKTPLTGFLLLIAVPALVAAQSSRGAPPAHASPNPRQISLTTRPTLLPMALEDQWTIAVVKRDAATFERLLAPGFVYTEDASVMTRGDVIRSVTGPDHVEWARNEGMKLHDFGDVHVITGVLHLRGRGRSGSFDRRYQFTDTWQHKKGHWQIIAAQDYLIRK